MSKLTQYKTVSNKQNITRYLCIAGILGWSIIYTISLMNTGYHKSLVKVLQPIFNKSGFVVPYICWQSKAWHAIETLGIDTFQLQQHTTIYSSANR